jgi:ribosomal protein L22
MNISKKDANEIAQSITTEEVKEAIQKSIESIGEVSPAFISGYLGCVVEQKIKEMSR